MRRRDVFKAALLGGVASVIPVANSKERLFGTPGSIIARDTASENKLRLLMSKGEIPLEVWEEVLDFSRVWSAVSSDPAVAGEFYSDRESFLKSMGVSERTINPRSIEEKLLLASHDPAIRKAATDGDYSSYLARLRDLGVFTATPTLRQRVDDLMKANNDSLKEFLARSISIQSLEKDYSSDLERLKALIEEPEAEGVPLQSKGNPGVGDVGAQPLLFVGAVAIAVVAVGVATYVMAGVNVAVGLNIATQISVVTKVAVLGSGGGGGGGCMNCHAVSSTSGNLDVETAAIRVAQVNGNSRFLFRGMRRQVRREVISCLYSAHEQGLISLPRSNRKQIFDLAARITFRMAGI